MLWPLPGIVSKFKLNEYYEKIISNFLSVSVFNPNTQSDVIWVARKYFAWLLRDGKHDLNDVGADEL